MFYVYTYLKSGQKPISKYTKCLYQFELNTPLSFPLRKLTKNSLTQTNFNDSSDNL